MYKICYTIFSKKYICKGVCDMLNSENRKIKECVEALPARTSQTIITDPETLKAFGEADYLAKNGGKKYKSFNEVMKDVLGNV